MVEINYKGSTISSLEADKTAILRCAEKITNTDIVIKATGAKASVSYDGNVIASLTDGQTVTLKCANKLMKSDISIVTESVIVISTMTIDGTAYQFESEMTWSEWVASSYNTDGYKVVDGVVTTADGTKRVEDQYVGAVTAEDEVVGEDYILVDNMQTLSTPSIEIDGTTLNIYDEEGLATEYDILVDGVVKETVEIPQGYNVTVTFQNSRGSSYWRSTTIYDGVDMINPIGSIPAADGSVTVTTTTGQIYITGTSSGYPTFYSFTPSCSEGITRIGVAHDYILFSVNSDGSIIIDGMDWDD